MNQTRFLLTIILAIAFFNVQAQRDIDSLKKVVAHSADDSSKVRSLNALSKLQLVQGNYPEALEFGFKALKIAEELNDELLIAQSQGNVGGIYLRQGKTSDARDYYRKSMPVFEKLDDKKGLGLILSNLGAVYLTEGKFDTALIYLERALSFNEASGAFDMMGMNIANIAGVYSMQKDYNRSLVYTFKSIRLNARMGDVSNRGIDEMNAGLTYFEAYKDSSYVVRPDSLMPGSKPLVLKTAIRYLEQAKKTISSVSGDINALRELYRSLALAYELAGNDKASLQNFKQFQVLQDSIFSTDNRLKIADLQTDRAKLEKEKQVQLNKVILTKKRNEQIFYGIGIALLLITIIFVSKERRKSDKLLLNILPAEVATELKKTGGTTARHFNEVTVLFTDFVNFTTVAERMDPQRLVDELHNCFKAFDNITSKYKIEKIKTVGDAYLAVSGLPLADPAHATNVIMAAIEIAAFVKQRKQEIGENAFDIRIGVNSGSVVAGIVGVKKFAYDIWGDTVNIASRMEQSSEAGKINISEATYELVKDQFKCTFRGEIEVKNKGKMGMYFVETGVS
jgi:adenylate cyclase